MRQEALERVRNGEGGPSGPSGPVDTPVAYTFHYMHASSRDAPLFDKQADVMPQLRGLDWHTIQPIGPSPVVIGKQLLSKVTPLWLNLSLALKRDPAADKRFGWVLEMWGYSVACAALGIEHRLERQFQVEPGAAYSGGLDDFTIFHYTYGIEFKMDGRPSGGIGEWSLDKRHYGAAYPPRQLQPPPARQGSAAPVAARWLLNAFNEASAGIPDWPKTLALGTVGWKRSAGDGIRGSDLAKRITGTSWTWSGIKSLTFGEGGALTTPWGQGSWGILPSGVDYNDGGLCRDGCAFADFSSALHNVRFNFDADPQTFATFRVGDGESVPGVRLS